MTGPLSPFALLAQGRIMRITGSTIFIPGSTSGIGEALAVALHEKGNTIIVGDRRRSQLDRIAAEHSRSTP